MLRLKRERGLSRHPPHVAEREMKMMIGMLIWLVPLTACTSISDSSNVSIERGPWISLHDFGAPSLPASDAQANK
jgi:hypothetical protein